MPAKPRYRSTIRGHRPADSSSARCRAASPSSQEADSSAARPRPRHGLRQQLECERVSLAGARGKNNLLHIDIDSVIGIIGLHCVGRRAVNPSAEDHTSRWRRGFSAALSVMESGDRPHRVGFDSVRSMVSSPSARLVANASDNRFGLRRQFVRGENIGIAKSRSGRRK